MIRAGLFTTTDSQPFSPEQLSEAGFLDHFRQHVTKAKTSTPFVSFFRGPLAPIHRGLSNGDGARVFIIETSKLSQKTFKAAPLAKLTGTETTRWKGYGEYLIWNEVPTDAIACTFSLTELKRIVSEHSDIGLFLQLPLIQTQQFCSLSLYSDLAKGMPESDDEHAGLLERFTTLLGVPERLRGSVANDFKRAWTRKFPGFEYRAPEADADIRLDENELLADHTGFKTIVHGEAVPSEASYAPPDTDGDNSSDSSSNDSQESGEAEEPCWGQDTPSPPWSVQDDSCDEIGEWSLTDPFVDENDLMEMDDEDACPDDNEYYVDRLIRWPADLAAPRKKGLWEADGM